MTAQPKLGLFLVIAAMLAITVAIAVDLPHVLYWRIAPEHYLMRVRGFYGQRLISDEGVSDAYAPTPLLAWRRLATRRDTAAFRRLLMSGTPAAKVYGLAGLQALASARSIPPAVHGPAAADSLYVNAECTEGVISLRAAFALVGTPTKARRLLLTPTVCP